MKTYTDLSTYLTVLETANRMGISKASVYRFIDDGSLTAFKVGTHVIRIDPDTVEAMIRKIQPGALISA